MVDLILETTPKARKPHQCFDCGRDIPKGTVHVAAAIKGDGFYTLRSHIDCAEASRAIVSEGYAPDYYDGVPPLYEMIWESGEGQDELDRMRGLWPHVVCRIELTEQLAQLRAEARMMEAPAW